MTCPDDPYRLLIDRDVTVRSVDAVQETLIQALADHGDVVVQFGEIEASDLTVVQLIEAARATADRDGKTLTLMAPAGGALREMLSRGGFIGEDGERSAAREFWLHEAAQ